MQTKFDLPIVVVVFGCDANKGHVLLLCSSPS